MFCVCEIPCADEMHAFSAAIIMKRTSKHAPKLNFSADIECTPVGFHIFCMHVYDFTL